MSNKTRNVNHPPTTSTPPRAAGQSPPSHNLNGCLPRAVSQPLTITAQELVELCDAIEDAIVEVEGALFELGWAGLE